MTIGGHWIIIIKKSEKAKLITRRLLGVLRAGVSKNTYTTTPFPNHPIIPKISITTPKHLCHSGFKGGNWYLFTHKILFKKV